MTELAERSDWSDYDRWSFNHAEVAFRMVADVGVAMRRGDLFEVDGAGLELLRTLRRDDVTAHELATVLGRRYNVSEELASTDVRDFLDSIYAAGLARPSGATCIEDAMPVGPKDPRAAARCWDIARAAHIPLKCKLDVTYRCNIACKFCYNGERPGLPGPYMKDDELTLGELEDVFQQLHDAGTLILTLTGGEPLARRDIGPILDLTDRFGFAVEVLTNGTLISPARAAEIATHRIQMVVVPVFGASAETHDEFVRRPGAFARACRGIEALRDAGIEVGVRCALTQLNFHEREAIREQVEAWGVRYFPHVQVHLSSDGAVDLRDIRLDDGSLAELFEEGAEINPGYRCDVGFARVDVLPNGDVALCSLLTEPLGNLREQRFIDIWNDAPRIHELRAALTGGVHGCNGCSVKADSGYRCSADALSDDGDLAALSSEALRVLTIAGARPAGA
jgi:MoaA/NifB/PqqE/SkfB family radical SAM enzyme